MKESDSRFRGWLLRETGIDPDSLGNDFLSRALTERVQALQGDGERLPSAARPPVTPEALDGGPIARIRDGDLIRLDAVAGTLTVRVAADEWAVRPLASEDLSASHAGIGRELFSQLRASVGAADRGASIFSGVNA